MTPKQKLALDKLCAIIAKDVDWVTDHEEGLRKLFPEEWQLILELNPLQIGFNLKLIGIDWRTDQEFIGVMTALTEAGFCYRNSYNVKRKNFPVLTRE